LPDRFDQSKVFEDLCEHFMQQVALFLQCLRQRLLERALQPSFVDVWLCHDVSHLRARERHVQHGFHSGDAAPTPHESRAEVIVLSPTFDADHQGGAAMMQYINSLTPQIRRRSYVVLVSPQLRTLDTYLAFANGVNLTLHPEDVSSFQSVLERSLRDFNELYRPLNQASSLAPF